MPLAPDLLSDRATILEVLPALFDRFDTLVVRASTFRRHEGGVGRHPLKMIIMTDGPEEVFIP